MTDTNICDSKIVTKKKKNLDVHYSSETDDWATPQEFFDGYHREFNFQLDVAASHENAKCDVYYTKEDDALTKDWYKQFPTPPVCWMNPPYGRGIKDWIKKAYNESVLGCLVVCLVPARTDTKWFHEYILHKAEIRFLRGRLKFGNCKNAAPFPSMICIFQPNIETRMEFVSYVKE